MKKIIWAVFFMALGAGLFWLYQNDFSIKIQLGKTSSPSPTPTTTVTVSPTLNLPTITQPTAVNAVSDLELIKTAFSQKYSKPVDQVEVTVSKNTGTYASGGVKFAGEIAGGWFLAAKQGGDWIIVADGNGVVLCKLIAPYNFPSDMVPECWDDTNNKLIKR